MQQRVILLHALAPPKPAPAAACNGCGVCCAAEPCPLGQWLSGRRRGACAALQWHEEGLRYVCGVVDDPGRWLPLWPAAWSRRLARRWIAAGHGCDSDLDAMPAPGRTDALTPRAEGDGQAPPPAIRTPRATAP